MNLSSLRLKSAAEGRYQFDVKLARIQNLDNTKIDQDKNVGSVKIEGDGKILESRYSKGFMSSAIEERVTRPNSVTVSHFEKGWGGPVSGASYSKSQAGYAANELRYGNFPGESGGYHAVDPIADAEMGFLLADARFRT